VVAPVVDIVAIESVRRSVRRSVLIAASFDKARIVLVGGAFVIVIAETAFDFLAFILVVAVWSVIAAFDIMLYVDISAVVVVTASDCAAVIALCLVVVLIATFEKYELVVDPGEVALGIVDISGTVSVVVFALMAIATGGDSVRTVGPVFIAYWLAIFVACAMQNVNRTANIISKMSRRSFVFTSCSLVTSLPV